MLVIKKSSLALFFSLPFLFVSDMLYGVMDYYGLDAPVSPGGVLRGGLLIIAVITLLYPSAIKRKGLLLFVWLIVVLAVPGLVVSLFSTGLLSFSYNLSDFSKAVYLPLVTLLFVSWVHKWNISSDTLLRYIEYSGYGLGVVLLSSQLAGINRMTYGDYAYGNLGVFYAQNDMTLAIGLGLLAAAYRLVNVQFGWVRFVLFIISVYACLGIGTRASIAVVFIASVVPIICSIWSAKNKGGSLKGLYAQIFVSVFLSFALVFLISEAFSAQKEFGYQKKKIEQIAEFEHPRLRLLTAGEDYMRSRSEIYNLIGEGAASFRRGVAGELGLGLQYRMVEVDWVDFAGSYGLLFTLVIHFFLILLILASLWRFIIAGNAELGLVAFAGTLYLGQGVFAGHAFSSPIPSTLMACYSAIYWGKKYYRLYWA